MKNTEFGKAPDRLRCLISALQVSSNAQTEALLGALLVDELSRRGADFGVPLISGKNAQHALDAEVEALTSVVQAYRRTNQHAALSDALDELADRVVQQTKGLARAHLLEAIWATMPFSMKAYGYLRTSYLDANFQDILLTYPDEQVPEDDLAAWISLAQTALRAGEHQEAENILTILQSDHPDNPFVGELRANTLIARGDVEAADAIYRTLEENYAWPAGLIRLSDQSIGAHHESAVRDEPVERFNWLSCAKAEKAGTLFVVGVDDSYAKRYLPELIDSLTRTHPDGSWLLHTHLVNPVQSTLDWIADQQLAGVPLAATTEYVSPRAAETTDTHRIVETRTYYACARFRILPHLLQHYARPLWVIDADMHAQRPVDRLLAETNHGERSVHIGIVPMERHARCVSEYVWLSLSYYANTPETLCFARTLSRHIGFHLNNDHWGWGLDQTAFFAVLAWFERHYPEFRVARIPKEFIAGRNANQPKAYFKSLVGSMQ